MPRATSRRSRRSDASDDPELFTSRYRELVVEGAVGRGYTALLRELLGDVSDDDLERFIGAEHEVWRPANQVLGSAQALLDALRGRGIKTGVVANSWPEPARLLRADVAAFGLEELLDVQVWSDEAGARKPEPEIFLRALDALGVDPVDAMFVGDRLDTESGARRRRPDDGASPLVHVADQTDGIEPDFMAFTPMDVLNIARRLGD